MELKQCFSRPVGLNTIAQVGVGEGEEEEHSTSVGVAGVASQAVWERHTALLVVGRPRSWRPFHSDMEWSTAVHRAWRLPVQA